MSRVPRTSPSSWTPLALDGDTAYSVFAIGSLADGTLTALPVVDATAIMGDEMAAESPEASE